MQIVDNRRIYVAKRQFLEGKFWELVSTSLWFLWSFWSYGQEGIFIRTAAIKKLVLTRRQSLKLDVEGDAKWMKDEI